MFFVDRKCFEPAPNVDSAIIKLEKKDKLLEVNNREFLFRLVREAFMMKRKNLRNNLRKYDLDKVAKVLSNYNLDLQARAEQVSLECFVDLANELESK